MSSLYERLGGAAGIAAIVHDVLENHLANPLIRPRYQHLDADRRANLIRITCDFFGAGTGGPETYRGRSMIDTHKGMNISEQEFVAALDDILAALDKNGVGEAEKCEVLGALYSMKSEIVRL